MNEKTAYLRKNFESVPCTVIEPSRSYFNIAWKEVFAYYELLFLLAKRDVTVIYKQTILGPFWFFVQPILSAGIFSVIFGMVAKIPTDGIPPFVFYMTGTIMWNYFSAVLNACAMSLFGNSALLSKVYFPRLIMPFSALLSNLVFLLLNFCVFGLVYGWSLFHGAPMHPSWSLLALPLVVLYTAFLGLGFGLWVAALTTKYRDMRFVLQFVLQLWMYLTPIIYPASIVANAWYRWLVWCNPVSIAIETTRYMFTGQGQVGLVPILMGVCITALVTFSGLIVFNRVQRNFVDTI